MFYQNFFELNQYIHGIDQYGLYWECSLNKRISGEIIASKPYNAICHIKVVSFGSYDCQSGSPGERERKLSYYLHAFVYIAL